MFGENFCCCVYVFRIPYISTKKSVMFYVFRVVGLASIMCFVLFLCVKSDRCDVFRIKKIKINATYNILCFMCCLCLASFFHIFLILCNLSFPLEISLLFIYLYIHYLFIHYLYIYNLFICNWIFYLANYLLSSNMSGNTPSRVLKGEMYAHSVQKSRFSFKTE